jgi:acetone carboxylase gamma subunit
MKQRKFKQECVVTFYNRKFHTKRSAVISVETVENDLFGFYSAALIARENKQKQHEFICSVSLKGYS